MRRLTGLLLAAALLLTAVGCGKSESGLRRFERTYLDVFDTVVQLIAYDTDESSFAAKAEQVHRELQRYDALYDIYEPHTGVNNLYTVNQNAGVAPVSVEADILYLLQFGKEMHTLSGGRVNIAAGAVLQLWHNARTAGLARPDEAALPSSTALQEAAQHTDIDDLRLDAEAGTVYLSDPAMRLDVGAIAKGYATEQVAKLAATLWEHAAVSAGGNVRVIGGKPSGSWEIGVESPSGDGLAATLQLETTSLVTSGDYQRYYTVAGKTYHHIIDPATQYPSVYHRSVTVLCVDSALADGLSTALFLMPLAEGKQLLETLDGVEALWIDADNKMTMTEGFERKLL